MIIKKKNTKKTRSNRIISMVMEGRVGVPSNGITRIYLVINVCDVHAVDDVKVKIIHQHSSYDIKRYVGPDKQKKTEGCVESTV